MPFPVGSLISGLGSLFGAGIGAISGSHNASKSLSAQRRENELNRQHNLKLAQLQNKWNMEMYDKNNEYNSPIEQRKRLQAAGLNPDLMYSGSGGLVAAQAPAMTAGEGSHSSVNPAIAPYDAAGNINNMFDNAVKMAQVGLIKAQTRKTEGEGDIVISDAKIRDALNQGQLELQGATIHFTDVRTDLTDAQIRKIQPEIDNLNSQTASLKQKIDESKAVVANLTQDEIYKRTQNLFASKMFQAQLRQYSASSGLSEAQAKRTFLLMGAELLGIQAQTNETLSRMHLNWSSAANIDADTGIKMAQGVIANIDADNAQLKFDLSRVKAGFIGPEFRSISSGLSVLTDIISAIVAPAKGFF